MALVSKRNNPNTKTYDTKVSVQMYSNRGYERLKKSNIGSNFDKIILVHDPRKSSEPELKGWAKELDGLTNDKIEAFARGKKIDLGDKTKKQDMLDFLLSKEDEYKVHQANEQITEQGTVPSSKIPANQ